MAIPAVMRTPHRRAGAVHVDACTPFMASAQTKDIERTRRTLCAHAAGGGGSDVAVWSVWAQSDYLMDLGSGDGVIVRTAALQMKASGLGIEIDPELVKRAGDEAQKAGRCRSREFSSDGCVQGRSVQGHRGHAVFAARA